MKKMLNFKNIKYNKFNILRILSAYILKHEQIRIKLLKYFKPLNNLSRIKLKQLDCILKQNIKTENIPLVYLKIVKLNQYFFKYNMNLYVFLYLSLYKRYFLKKTSCRLDYSDFLLENLEINEFCNMYFKNCKESIMLN